MSLERDQINALLIAAGLVAGFAAVAWLPGQLRERNLRNRLDEATQQASLDNEQARILPVLTRDVAQIQATADGLARPLASETEMAQILRNLSQAMSAQRVTNQEIQTQSLMPGGDYNRVPMFLRFHGSFESAFNLVRTIEQSPQPIRIDKFDLMCPPSQPGAPKLVANIELSALLKPAPATATVSKGGQP